jgi:hypothetical protein
MASENSAGVSVDYEYRMIAGVKKNGIGGLRANAIQCEKFFAQ